MHRSGLLVCVDMRVQGKEEAIKCDRASGLLDSVGIGHGWVLADHPSQQNLLIPHSSAGGDCTDRMMGEGVWIQVKLIMSRCREDVRCEMSHHKACRM